MSKSLVSADIFDNKNTNFNLKNNKRLRDAFAKLDADHDQRIRLYDLHHMLDETNTDHSLKPPEIKRLLSLADTNHDGSIDFNEFVRMVKNWKNLTPLLARV